MISHNQSNLLLMYRLADKSCTIKSRRLLKSCTSTSLNRVKHAQVQVEDYLKSGYKTKHGKKKENTPTITIRDQIVSHMLATYVTYEIISFC